MANVPYRQEVSAADIAQAVASVKPLSAAVAAARQEAGPDALIVAWVSDLHLHAQRDYDHEDLDFYGTQVDTSANLRLALAEISALHPSPDLLILGGDLADSGCGGEAPADEYDELAGILDAHLPAGLTTLPLLGNHDHADRPLSDAFHHTLARLRPSEWPAPVVQEDFYYETYYDRWRFVALDSRQGQPLSLQQRDWLSMQLTRPEAAPTVVLVHRPFVSVGNWVDHYRLEDRGSFDVVDRAPMVRGIFSGHTHKAKAWWYRGKAHIVFPSTAYGIGDSCGWGCVILAAHDVHTVFVKDLAARAFDNATQVMRQQRGDFRELSLSAFESNELYDPCTLPR